MQDPKVFPLPFLLRDMLRFEYGTTFELVVSSKSTVASEVNIVGATREGIFKYTITTSTATAVTQNRFRIPDIPIWVSVIDKNETINKSDVWVRVDLAINTDKMYGLLSGYVYQVRGITWPMTNLQPLDPYEGAIVATNAANPAAGANWNQTVPDGEMWRIMSIRFTLTTSATAASRRVHVSLEIAGSPAFELISSIDQTASLVRNYTCQATGGEATFSEDNDILIPMPSNMLIPGGDIMKSVVTNLQAADDFGVAVITYERFLFIPRV